MVHVGVQVGDGLVARFGDALLLVVEPGQHRERAEDLLAAVEAASEAVPPGATVANRLAAIVAGREPGTTPAFGAVAPLAEGYVVLLHGPVSAEIASPLGVVRLAGEQAVTWVDHKVEVAVDRLSVTSHDHPVQVDPMSDLRAGLVPGSGFVLTPGRAADSTQPEQGGASPLSAGVSGGTGSGTGAGSGTGTGTGTGSGTGTGTGTGSKSSGGRAAAATLEPTGSQARTAPRSSRSTEALSQPIGHLVAADGLRIPLDRAYVIGREPEADPAVTSGAATPVRLSDDENLISRVQTYLAVENEQVSVRDASSANGTFVAAPGAEAWTRVGDDPVELAPSWSMRVGNQVFTYVAVASEP
jgi:FHA domain